MLEEYDIDKLNPRPNPYAKELKKQITIKIAPSVIDYFKSESQESLRSVTRLLTFRPARRLTFGISG